MERMASVDPGQTMTVDARTKYLVKDVNIKKTIDIWMNGILPSRTIIEGTGWAKLYYCNEAFVTVS